MKERRQAERRTLIRRSADSARADVISGERKPWEGDWIEVPVVDGVATLPDGRTVESAADIIRVIFDSQLD